MKLYCANLKIFKTVMMMCWRMSIHVLKAKLRNCILPFVKRCPKHGRGKYSKQFDTYYCSECDRWLEKKCPTPKLCLLCANRPRKPSLVQR